MGFHCSDEEGLNIFHEHLIDGDLLLHHPGPCGEPLVLLDDRGPLWTLRPSENVRDRSSRYWHIIDGGQIPHERVTLILQSVQALKDGDSGLIDRNKLLERHPLDRITLLQDILRKMFTLHGFTRKKVAQLIKGVRDVHHRQPAHP